MVLPYCIFCTALGWGTLSAWFKCKMPSCQLKANLRRRKSEVQKYVQVFSFHTTDSSGVVINVIAIPGKIVAPVGICVLMSLKGRHSKDVNLPCLSFERLSKGIQVLCAYGFRNAAQRSLSVTKRGDASYCISSNFQLTLWHITELGLVNPCPCFMYWLCVYDLPG